MKEKRQLRTIDFISVFFRTFFIQAVWNFKSLISIGLCFAIIPVAKRLCRTKEEYICFLKRHLCFFNSHPYFASYALGSIAKIEEEYANTPGADVQQIEKFKNALIGPLGAIGDQCFWAAVKPASLLIGFSAIALVPELKQKLLFLVVLLILYNVPHLYIRAVGLWKGYSSGYNIYRHLKIEKFALIKNIYQYSGAVALGLFAGYALNLASNTDYLKPVFFLGSVITAYWLKRRNQAVYLPILIPVMLAVLFGVLVINL